MKGCMDSSMRPFYHSGALTWKKKVLGLGLVHAKESFTSILFIRAIKTRPLGTLPLKLHARRLWFFICFHRPYVQGLSFSMFGRLKFVVDKVAGLI